MTVFVKLWGRSHFKALWLAAAVAPGFMAGAIYFAFAGIIPHSHRARHPITRTP